MNRHLLAAAIAASLFATAAQAVTFGEPFNPSKFRLVESSTGVTSGLYNGNSVGTVLILSGASASSKTLGTHIISDLCNAATLSVLWDSAAGSSYRAYACDTKAGNPLTNAVDSLVIIKRDAGGSKQGVDPILVPARIDMMQVGEVASSVLSTSLVVPLTGAAQAITANTCTATGNAAGLNTPSHLCGTTVKLLPDAGLSDVEPAIINNTVNGGTNLTAVVTPTIKSIFQQVMGVGVNLKLYRALQATQGLTQDDAEANRPSIPRSFVASAALNKLVPGAKRGWEIVVSPTVDAAVGTRQVNVCRRTDGSGTQAAANVYFGQAPCSPSGVSPAADNQATRPLAAVSNFTSVKAVGSAGALETCLKDVDNLAGTAYAIGHISRDNDPFAGGVDKKYRFVKIDGAQPEAHPDPTTGKCDSTRNFAGCSDAQSGKYDYVFESTMQWSSATPGNAAKATALNNMATNGFKSAQLLGNNAAVVGGVMALPTYAGNYENLALGNVDQVYGSRVTRGASSCAPLYLLK